MIEIEDASPLKCPITTKLVLDEDEETKEPLVQVHRSIVTRLKPHQVDGKTISFKCICFPSRLVHNTQPELESREELLGRQMSLLMLSLLNI